MSSTLSRTLRLAVMGDCFYIKGLVSPPLSNVINILASKDYKDVLELAESNVTQHPDCQFMNLNRWLLMILCVPSEIY
ncbi:hypothetical protein L1887_19610 [Cichorium endivia]|nr:hypothetical protein L1887_19610 [Cichorium endivia]